MDSSEAAIKFSDLQTLLPAVPSLPRAPLHNLPFPRNPKFFGREAELAAIDTTLAASRDSLPSRSIALYGLGGVGKSHLALEYAYRRLNNYQVVFWLKAETSLSLLQSFTDIAIILELGNVARSNRTRDDMVMSQSLVLSWLQAAEVSWLLIFDNAESSEDLSQIWPNYTSGNVIVTTRQPALSICLASNTLEVSPFTAEEGGAALLLWRPKFFELSLTDTRDAIELSRLLGGLPLALDIMAHQMARRRQSISQFLQFFRNHSQRILNTSSMPLPYYDHSLSTVWLLSFTVLPSRSFEFLGILSFLSPDSISTDLMLKSEDDSSFFCEDKLELNDILDQLLDNSLIRRDPETDTIFIHRLVQKEFHSQLTDSQLSKSFQLASAYVLQRFPSHKGGTSELELRKIHSLLDHVQALERNVKEFPSLEVGEEFLALVDRARSWKLITDPPNEEQVDMEFDNQSFIFSDSGYGGSENFDSTPEIVSGITRIVHLLITDSTLIDISKDAIGARGAEGFEHGFANLLKIYAEDLRKAASYEYQHQACRLIDTKGMNIAVRFRSLISPSEKNDYNFLPTLLPTSLQSKDVVERFLKTLPDSSVAQIQKNNEADNEGLSETAGRSSVGLSTESQVELIETAEESLDNVEIAEQFILAGVAFSNLKENLKAAFLPSKAGLPEGLIQDESQHGDTTSQISQLVKMIPSQDINPAPLMVVTPQSLSGSQLACGEGQPSVFSALVGGILRIMEYLSWQLLKLILKSMLCFGETLPLLQPGRVRLHWGCDCGQTFSYNISSSDWQSSVSRNQFQLRRERTSNESKLDDGFGIVSHAPGTSAPANGPHFSVVSGDVRNTYPIDSNSALGDISTSEELSRSSNDDRDIPLIEQGGIRNRKYRVSQRNESKWVLVCLPGKLGRKDPGTIRHLCAKAEMDDNHLLQEIKNSYESGRSKWDRISRLHCFSKVRLIKFRLLKIRDLADNTWAFHNEWTWPGNEDIDWECHGQDIPVEIFDQHMLHHWNNPGHRTTSRKKALEAKSRVAKLWLWLQQQFIVRRRQHTLHLRNRGPGDAQVSQLHTPAINLSGGPATEYAGESPLSNSEQFLQFKNVFYAIFQSRSADQIMSDQHILENVQNEAREVDLDPSECWVFHSTPKKLKEKLTWTSGRCPPPGWGICVEEKFSVPWYVVVFLSLIPTMTIGFAVGWWVHHGPTTFGVASAAIGWLSFIFTLWVAVSKDSQN